MAYQSQIVHVTDVATRLDKVDETDYLTTANVSALTYGSRIMVTNRGPADIKIGDAAVTASTGFTVPAQTTWIDSPNNTDHIYAITADGGSATCEVLQGGV